MNPKAKEPSTAPPAEQWYPLTLGSTLQEQSSTRFYSLRYEFKPASIDTSRPGSLHKSVENKVTVEFCNNQAGKPKVSFQGNSEECKDLDGIIFFDGKSFRLERLHRAVKSLRHVRLPGESAGAAVVGTGGGGLGTSGTSSVDPSASPGHVNGGAGSGSNFSAEKISQKAFPVQVEEITIGQADTSVEKKTNKRKADAKVTKGQTSPAPASPALAKIDNEVQIDIDDEVEEENAKRLKAVEAQQPDVNVDEEIVEEHESDYEIEDVDVSEDEEDGDKVAANAAEALRAQAAAENQKQQSSSESGSSGSGSSGSGSGSSSSGSDGSDDEEDSGSSGDDI